MVRRGQGVQTQGEMEGEGWRNFTDRDVEQVIVKKGMARGRKLRK